jgi:hypothetical protein
MRLEKLQSANQKPIGEGDDHKVFVDPNHEGKVIVETKNDSVKETLPQLKGKYYLTKIAHTLLPDHIPNIHQATEWEDGAQTIDRERAPHTIGQEKLQKTRSNDGNEEEARKLMLEEMGSEMTGLDMKLEDIGLGFNIDSNVGNYTRSASGKINYLETFKPWQVDIANPKELEVLFDESTLREAINKLTDKEARKECLQHLERLINLMDEEKKNLREQKKPDLPDCRERVEAFNSKYAPYLTEESLAHLNAIASMKEALEDIQRKSVKIILGEILLDLQALKNETNISEEDYGNLYAKRNALMRAHGTLRNGTIDHTEPK